MFILVFISVVVKPLQGLPENRTCHLPGQQLNFFKHRPFYELPIPVRACTKPSPSPFELPFSSSVASKRIFSVYSVMFFIMKLMYCLLFLFLYSKCWIICHGSVWPGSDVLSLAAVFLLHDISGTSLFCKSTFLLWGNFYCVPVFHNIYVRCLLQMIVCCIHKNKVF